MSPVPAWLARWEVTGTWAEHIAWGSRGGVDWGAPPGTPIRAASDGVVSYRVMSDGSSVARVTRPDGTATEMLHGIPRGASGRSVRRDEIIATSDGREGHWGAGNSTGSGHIHGHDLDKQGNRVPPFSTIPSGGGAGGGGATTNNSEEEIMRGRSVSSGTWYIIPELAPPTAITTGKAGSKNHKRALAYNMALGSGFPEMSSEAIRSLLDDNAARRSAFFAESAAAAGLDDSAVAAGIARIEAEIAELKAGEPEGEVDTAELAALIRQGLAAEVASELADDLEAMVATLQSTIPASTLTLLAQKLVSTP